MSSGPGLTIEFHPYTFFVAKSNLQIRPTKQNREVIDTCICKLNSTTVSCDIFNAIKDHNMFCPSDVNTVVYSAIFVLYACVKSKGVPNVVSDKIAANLNREM